jgi:hypothetical protein
MVLKIVQGKVITTGFFNPISLQEFCKPELQLLL